MKLVVMIPAYNDCVDDIIEANLLAAENDLVGEVFNIGNGSRISVNDLIKKIEKIVGNKAKVKYVEKRKGDARDTWADVSRTKKELTKKKQKMRNKKGAAIE